MVTRTQKIIFDQKGILRVQYITDKIYLITSPKYSKSYTNGKTEGVINNFPSTRSVPR